ncbi:MAG: hypothetical protein RLZZ192_713 [Pseudomonadota bacterium]|jgi:hypothetical protein
MIQNKQKQTDGDEISSIELLLFLKTSGGNIVKSTLACLLVGGAYYFCMPNMYRASAIIETAKVNGELVESPFLLIRKMKSPNYFSPSTLQICGSYSQLGSQANFDDKIKATVIRSTTLVSFATQAESTREAEACLNAVIAEVLNNHSATAKPLIDTKKQQHLYYTEQLKRIEQVLKLLLASKGNNYPTDTQLSSHKLSLIVKAIQLETDIRLNIEAIEKFSTISYPAFLVSPVHAPEVPTNKSLKFIFGLCLTLGMILGLLLTGLMQLAPDILRKIREAESRAN